MVAFALVLLLASAAGWIAAAGTPPRARTLLRLAAALYAALSVAGLGLSLVRSFIALPGQAGLAVIAVTDLVATLGPVVLCVAAYSEFRKAPRALSASLVLGAGALVGLAAAATGFRVVAAVPQVLSAVFTFLIARPGLWRRAHVYLALAAISILGGAACQLAAGLTARAGVLLFEAAALIGVAIASDVLVETRAQNGGGLGVSAQR